MNRAGQPLDTDAAGATGQGASLTFDAVSKSYVDLIALHPTTVEIARGEFFALIGPSGSGKSTLLGMTAGFIPPSGGGILVNGKDVTGVPPYRRNIGMVFQNYALFPHMTVAENISFPLRMRGRPRVEIAARVRRLLAMVHLDALEDRSPNQLSGGQQQRVALARAAVYDPDLLLMDEPLGALDKNLREEMQDEIKRFQSELGTTVLYVTHDQQEAASMADRIAVLRAGRIEQIGSPCELYRAPANRFVASFLGEANLFDINLVEGSEGGLCHAIMKQGWLAKVRPPGSAQNARATALMVRPEHVALGQAAQQSENLFTGTVQEVVFMAGSIRYRLLLDGDASILARAPLLRGTPVFHAGERIPVGWDAESSSLVTED